MLIVWLNVWLGVCVVVWYFVVYALTLFLLVAVLGPTGRRCFAGSLIQVVSCVNKAVPSLSIS